MSLQKGKKVMERYHILQPAINIIVIFSIFLLEESLLGKLVDILTMCSHNDLISVMIVLINVTVALQGLYAYDL